MEKSSAPFSLGGEPNGISIRGNGPFKSEPITMVYKCTRRIVIGSFLAALPLIEIYRFKLVHSINRMGQNNSFR